MIHVRNSHYESRDSIKDGRYVSHHYSDKSYSSNSPAHSRHSSRHLTYTNRSRSRSKENHYRSRYRSRSRERLSDYNSHSRSAVRHSSTRRISHEHTHSGFPKSRNSFEHRDSGKRRRSRSSKNDSYDNCRKDTKIRKLSPVNIIPKLKSEYIRTRDLHHEDRPKSRTTSKDGSIASRTDANSPEHACPNWYDTLTVTPAKLKPICDDIKTSDTEDVIKPFTSSKWDTELTTHINIKQDRTVKPKPYYSPKSDNRQLTRQPRKPLLVDPPAGYTKSSSSRVSDHRYELCNRDDKRMNILHRDFDGRKSLVEENQYKPLPRKSLLGDYHGERIDGHLMEYMSPLVSNNSPQEERVRTPPGETTEPSLQEISDATAKKYAVFDYDHHIQSITNEIVDFGEMDKHIEVSGVIEPLTDTVTQFSAVQSVLSNQTSPRCDKVVSTTTQINHFDQSHSSYRLAVDINQHPYHVQKSISPNQYSSQSNQFSAPSNQYPAPSNQYPAPSNQYPAPSNQYPAQSNQYPAQSNQYPAQSNQFSIQSNQYPAQSERMFPALPPIMDSEMMDQIISLASMVSGHSKPVEPVVVSPRSDWRLISLDAPLRVSITKNDIDLTACNREDPRLRFLF